MSTPLARKVLRAEPPQHSQGTELTPPTWRALRDGRLAVAVCRRCAFSDVWRWQDIDAMRSSARRWQDMREMRSRVTGSGNILARCVPPASDGGRIAP